MLPERLCLRFACRFFFLRSSAFRALTVLRAMEVGYFRTGGNATPSSDCLGKVEVAAIDPKSEIERRLARWDRASRQIYADWLRHENHLAVATTAGIVTRHAAQQPSVACVSNHK
jgi:hypothetical protein